MRRNLGLTKISPISNIARTNGKFHRQELKATKKLKSPVEELTPTNFPAKQWNAGEFPASISSVKLWTSPASSADLISSGPGPPAPQPAARYNLQVFTKRNCRAANNSS